MDLKSAILEIFLSLEEALSEVFLGETLGSFKTIEAAMLHVVDGIIMDGAL